MPAVRPAAAPRGTQVYYVLAKKPNKVGLKVVDFTGKVVRELRATSEPGLNVVTWDLLRTSLRVLGPRNTPFAEAIAPGMYRVVLTVDGEEMAQSVRVEADPTTPGAIITGDEQDEEEEHEKEMKGSRIDD